MLSVTLYTGDDSKLDSDEAEYAWLSLDSLKPFREGDSLTGEDETHISDPTLTACIAAAERAVKVAADKAAAAGDAEPEGEDEDGAESMSDSEGGERGILQCLCSTTSLRSCVWRLVRIKARLCTCKVSLL